MRNLFKTFLWTVAGMAFAGHAFAAKCDVTATGLASAIKSPVAYAIAAEMEVKQICKMQSAREGYDRMLTIQYGVVPETNNKTESDLHAVVGYLIQSRNYLAAQEIAHENYLATKGNLALKDMVFIDAALKPTMEDVPYDNVLNMMSTKLKKMNLDPQWRKTFTLAGYSIIHEDNIGLKVAKGMVEKSASPAIVSQFKAFTAEVLVKTKEMRAAYAGNEGHDH